MSDLLFFNSLVEENFTDLVTYTSIALIVALLVAAFGILCNIAGLELGNLWAFSDLGNILIVFTFYPIMHITYAHKKRG